MQCFGVTACISFKGMSSLEGLGELAQPWERAPKRLRTCHTTRGHLSSLGWRSPRHTNTKGQGRKHVDWGTHKEGAYDSIITSQHWKKMTFPEKKIEFHSDITCYNVILYNVIMHTDEYVFGTLRLKKKNLLKKNHH